MADYDIGNAFSAIESELIASMIRNLERHKAEEIAEGMNWSQWQVEQLNALDEYKRRNAKKYGTRFSSINDKIEEMLTSSFNDGSTAQERDILKTIKKGFVSDSIPFTGNTTITGEFFKTNDRKLDALIKATTDDMKRAETAVLRMTNDKYRKIIFNAQVYANTGAGTYEKAVDMATKDFLSAGINCIEYKNGRRVNIKSYAEMAIRTANKRAYLQGEGEMRKKWGIHTVILNKRSNACPKCLPYVGKVIVDDVWSGGTAAEAREKGYLLMSECIEKGLYHPNCKDSHSTYFGDILDEEDEDEEFEDSTEEKQEKAQDQPAQSLAKPEPITPKEQKQCEDLYNAEQYQQYAERQAEKWDRMSEFSLDKDNKRIYRHRANSWKEKVTVFKEKVKTLLSNFTKKGSVSFSKLKYAFLNVEVEGGFKSSNIIADDIKSNIISSIEKYMNKYNVTVDSIVFETLLGQEKVPFQFQAENVGGKFKSKLVINKAFNWEKDLEKMNERIYNRNYKSGILASQNVEDLIGHEMAHVMSFQDCDTYQDFIKKERFLRYQFEDGVSGYSDAMQDGSETLAEGFVRMKNGEEVPESVRELVETHVERWLK